MPGNLVVINGSDRLTWCVGDSNMDKLIDFLNKICMRFGDEDSYDKDSYEKGVQIVEEYIERFDDAWKELAENDRDRVRKD